MKISKILAWVFAATTIALGCLALGISDHFAKEKKDLEGRFLVVKRMVDNYETGHSPKLNSYYEILLKLGDVDYFDKEVLFFRVKRVYFDVAANLSYSNTDPREIRVPKSGYVLGAKYLTVINSDNSLKTVYFENMESVRKYQLSKE